MALNQLTPTTNAEVSTFIFVRGNGDYVTVGATNLVGDERVFIQYVAAPDVFLESGHDITAQQCSRVIVGSGVWRLWKPYTSQPSAICANAVTRMANSVFESSIERAHGFDYGSDHG